MIFFFRASMVPRPRREESRGVGGEEEEEEDLSVQ
jgi:hypothetical protein